MSSPEFDVCVIGTGAGGGVMIDQLTAAGFSVVALERGPELALADVDDDELRNVIRDQVFSRDQLETFRTDAKSRAETGRFSQIAHCVGGTLTHWAAWSWRFRPDEFKILSTEGPVAGASLADWPIDYAELEPFYVLTAAEWKTLEAITARIVPTDHEPGAREAGCTNFIDKALANEEEAARPHYQAGLRGIDAAARAGFARPFAELAEAEQDAVLVALEAGTAKGWSAKAGASREFFETVRAHTIIAFLAHPKYGGNRDYAGWRVTHYPGPRHHEGGYTPEQVTGAAKVTTIWGGEQ